MSGTVTAADYCASSQPFKAPAQQVLVRTLDQRYSCAPGHPFGATRATGTLEILDFVAHFFLGRY